MDPESLIGDEREIATFKLTCRETEIATYKLKGRPDDGR